MTAAMCGGNYAERLRPLLIAGRSSLAAAGSLQRKGEREREREMEGKKTVRQRIDRG